MNFASLPEEARPIAKALCKHLKKRVSKMALEKAPWSDAPYCPTVVSSSGGSLLLVEVQSHVQYHTTFMSFVRWVSSKRHNAEVFVATDKDSQIPAKDLEEMKNDGVGLLLVEASGKVTTHLVPRNPALVVNCDPTLKFGSYKKKIDEAIIKFNTVNRKDGLKDMCEIVELLTETLITVASKKGWFTIPAASIADKDFSEQINTLGAQNVYKPSKKILLDDPFKQDMHSFRGARNLVSHKVTTKGEEFRRQRQYQDKMVMGSRLAAELVLLHRRVK